MNNINEKIAICYVCCGPTYRETAKYKLENIHIDNPNLYYFIITDDKNYFNGINRVNLIVKELKDFYNEYPDLEKYEYFLESKNAEDYANKFITNEYKFPFSTYRFHLLLASQYNIQNIALLGTDTDLNLSLIDNEFLSQKNKIYNAVSRWLKNISEENMTLIADILYEKYNLSVDDELMIFDAAGRFFVFDSNEKLLELFNVWNDIMFTLYKNDTQKYFGGWYARNDEYILAPIYNALKINYDKHDNFHNLFIVNHNPSKERFWMY
jgi:hypothetical protein